MVTAPAGRPDPALPAAYAACERIARAHYENFPVASRLLPAAMRPHIAAIYAFARRADDFADEPGIAAAERIRLLDQWEHWLVTGAPHEAGNDATEIFTALSATIERFALPVQLFRDLLSAFRQDVAVHRYETWDQLADYCRRSANPVGRLVLRVAGYDDAALDTSSDALCTALQLTNFWQDVERDWQNGRLYVPAEETRRAGALERDLALRRITPEWRTALEQSTRRTRALFGAGRHVCDGVHGRLGWELRLTWLGGSRILDKLEAAGFDIFNRRPTIGSADVPALLLQAATWRRRAAAPVTAC